MAALGRCQRVHSIFCGQHTVTNLDLKRVGKIESSCSHSDAQCLGRQLLRGWHVSSQAQHTRAEWLGRVT